MSKYEFTFLLPSSDRRRKTYRMAFQAVVTPASEEGVSALSLSFDAFHLIQFNEIPVNRLPVLLFGDILAKSFVDDGKNACYLRLNLKMAADKDIALAIVDRLLSCKDIGYETPAATIISTLASRIEQGYAPDLGDSVISSQLRCHELFALYQALGGTKTLAHFETQAPTQSAVFGAKDSLGLFIVPREEAPREKHPSRTSCCSVM